MYKSGFWLVFSAYVKAQSSGVCCQANLKIVYENHDQVLVNFSKLKLGLKKCLYRCERGYGWLIMSKRWKSSIHILVIKQGRHEAD